jgi:GT2 family glycosyltransferase
VPSATIAIPTRGRTEYLDVTLASVAPQAAAAGVDLLVVSDGPDLESRDVAERHRARFAQLPESAGANAARNAAIAATDTELIVFIDDDVQVPAGWLEALLAGVHEAPEHDVFGGPIWPRLEGGGPRACGREPAPITTLDLGPEDRDADFVWSANMAVRRRAFDRVGVFDETIFGRGEEEEWERRYLASGGRIRYLAKAGLHHRRTAADATVPRLSRAAYELGRSARRNDVRKESAPARSAEVRTLAGCVWHIGRRRCAVGIVLSAHSAGRLREALTERNAPGPARSPDTQDRPDFLSGTSGQVFGIRATSKAVAADALADAIEILSLRRARLRRATRNGPRRRVLVLAVERAGEPNLVGAARSELERSRHEVHFVATDVGGRGKFENLNKLLRENPVDACDWLFVLDDDVALPRGFLDAFVFLAEHFGLQLAQPAHRALSHAAWKITRRQPLSVVRETAFVEIGPVVAFHREVFDTLLPFPELRAGWGLDAHWSAIARERDWRLGVVDATPIRHTMRRLAASYDREAAIVEASKFLAERPYTRAVEAQRTRVTHRSFR